MVVGMEGNRSDVTTFACSSHVACKRHIPQIELTSKSWSIDYIQSLSPLAGLSWSMLHHYLRNLFISPSVTYRIFSLQSCRLGPYKFLILLYAIWLWFHSGCYISMFQRFPNPAKGKEPEISKVQETDCNRWGFKSEGLVNLW